MADFAVLGMLSFFITQRPMVDFANNFVQIFNEVIILLLVISLVIFTDFIPDPVTRYDRGYTMLYIIGFSIFVNVAILIYSIVSKICTACRNCLIKRRKQKMIAQLALKKKEGTTIKVEASNLVLSEIIEE